VKLGEQMVHDERFNFTDAGDFDQAAP